MLKNSTFLLVVTIISSFSQTILPNLTTMQFWDPSPHYSANNFMMPSHSAIGNLHKAQKKDIEPSYERKFGISVTGFVQGACKATDHSHCKHFETQCGTPSKGKELGDFRGTAYAMGLFLGLDPNGKSIWENGLDTANAINVTDSTIDATQLPACLKEAAKALAADDGMNNYLVYKSNYATSSTPSIFSEKYLEDDKQFFGAFSTPLEYKKFGLRLELHADITKNIGATIQTGISNIKHRTTGLLNLSECPPMVPVCHTSGTTQGTSLYNQLDYGTTNTETQAQAVFKQYVAHNIDKLLDNDCGINQITCNFDDYSIEDIRFMLHFKHTYGLDHFTKNEDDDHEWAQMLFTPYAWAGVSIPTAKERDYDLLFSLPFGNNGHASAGGGLGMCFDFAETIEVGVEGGVTYFVSHEETRPFPNHKLQRVLYPYRTKVRVEPGLNWHFKALLNAYQFIKHVNFWATYEFIEHRQDKFILCGNNNNTVTIGTGNDTREERIFIPEVLECISDWRAQFINLALVFDIQPGLQASLLWQQPISPRNAYHPVSVTGSISFTF